MRIILSEGTAVAVTAGEAARVREFSPPWRLATIDRNP